MFSFFTPYRSWIEIGVLVAAILALLVGVHKFLDYEQQIGYDRRVAEDNVALGFANKAARDKEALWRKQLEDANERFDEREKANQTAITAANAALGRLRNTTQGISSGVPGATAASLANSVVALSTVSGECAAKYIEMAGVAGRHANDIQRILDSWPKAAVTP